LPRALWRFEAWSTRGAPGILRESFDVIGSNVPPEMNRAYAERVRFRGYVDELGGVLQEYDVMVVPIRFGSGTKLKVLEAMANGIPIVSTPQDALSSELVNLARP
jgi:glycosyltransferase involved in cell wall biosynthesis